MDYWNELVHLFYLGIAFFMLIFGFLILFKATVGVLPLPAGLQQAIIAA